MAERKSILNEHDFQEVAQKVSRHSTVSWAVIHGSLRSRPSVSSAREGFLAVSYLKNRDSTGDIDYLIDPEFAGDREVQAALRTAIHAVADRFEFTKKWINEDMAIFVTKEARRTLFAQAERQGITLFRGEHLEILAAPLEWALERKLRRIHAADRDRKAEYDMADAVALLRHLKERDQGLLDAERIRRMNTNGFDVLPDGDTMERVAREYRRKYHEDVFR